MTAQSSWQKMPCCQPKGDAHEHYTCTFFEESQETQYENIHAEIKKQSLFSKYGLC